MYYPTSIILTPIVTRLHQYSTYPLTAFLALHITNTSLLPLITPNLPAASTYLLLTRPFYQSRLLEPLVVTIPLTTHILSGIALRFLRRQQALSRYGTLPTTKRTSSPWPTLSFSSITGYALLPLALSHTFLNRILPLIYEGGSSDISLEYVGHGIARSPVVLTVAYFLLVTVGVAHGVWGWARWLGLLPGQVTVRDGDGSERAWKRKSRAYGVTGTAAVVGLTWLAGGLGVVGRGGKVKGWVGALWDGLYEKVWL